MISTLFSKWVINHYVKERIESEVDREIEWRMEKLKADLISFLIPFMKNTFEIEEKKLRKITEKVELSAEHSKNYRKSQERRR